MVKIGILAVGDERENANKRILPFIKEQEKKLLAVLEQAGYQAVVVEEPVNSYSSARRAGKFLAGEEVEGTIFNAPTFEFPKYAVVASMSAPSPFLIVGELDPRQPSAAGVAGIGGAFTQLGVKHERLWANLSDPEARKKIEVFCAAAHAANSLRGQVLGVFGGRSMGLYPMCASAKEYARKFHVDVDHVDQLEIVLRAKDVAQAKVEKALLWLEENAEQIAYDDILTKEKLEEQIRYYEAFKAIMKEKEYDFTAIKCHYELSEYCVPLCIGAMLCNDPYDWDGQKEPTVFACEADMDGALTMQVLKLVSRDQPTCLLDMRYYNSEQDVFLLQNCGSAPSWFAARDKDCGKNLQSVCLKSCVPKFQGGGAQISFWFGAGDYTLARLFQDGDSYKMIIVKGNSSGRIDSVPEGEEHWPKVHMRMDTNLEDLTAVMNCVHLHAIAGNYTEELKAFCRLMEIEPVILSK